MSLFLLRYYHTQEKKTSEDKKKSGNKQNNTSLFQRMIFPSKGLCRKKKASTRKIRRGKQTQENGPKHNVQPSDHKLHLQMFKWHWSSASPEMYAYILVLRWWFHLSVARPGQKTEAAGRNHGRVPMSRMEQMYAAHGRQKTARSIKT